MDTSEKVLKIALPSVIACVAVLAGSASAQRRSSSLLAEGGKTTARNNSRTDKLPGRPAVIPGDDYVIGPEDVLAVDVWKEQEVSRTVPVRPDGKISLPLIGDLEASGRTPMELRILIAQKLKAYLTSPEVAVIVLEVKSRKFNVFGQVLKPGSYPLSERTTVLDAIAAAGGFQQFVKTSKIYVLRRTHDGSKERLPFNYKEVIKGNDPQQDIDLLPDDTVVIP